jgi:Fatty acid desaturase
MSNDGLYHGIQPSPRFRIETMQGSTSARERLERRSDALDISGIDFDAFAREPLDPDCLRCLRYMHDVEHHTICYLRDLLVTPLHRDPVMTKFLSIWAYEEHWHGEALGRVLAAHGEVANETRVAALRHGLGVRDGLRPLISQFVSSILPGATALHLAWGAVNEWTTQSAYARLAKRADNPVLSELLRRIMRQEGRHIDFYTHEAAVRLSEHPSARRATRYVLRHFWEPVGAGVMPSGEVDFLTRYLFGGEEGLASAARVDRQIDRLSGLSSLHLVERAVRVRAAA